MDSYLQLLWLVPLGFFTGGYGTLIGAGGGFILVPALLFIYPGEAPETITSISLAVVFFNALSGTLAYARSGSHRFQSGIDFRAGNRTGSGGGCPRDHSGEPGAVRPRVRLVVDRSGDLFSIQPRPENRRRDGASRWGHRRPRRN
jgi:hypothetical protein